MVHLISYATVAKNVYVIINFQAVTNLLNSCYSYKSQTNLITNFPQGNFHSLQAAGTGFISSRYNNSAILCAGSIN